MRLRPHKIRTVRSPRFDLIYMSLRPILYDATNVFLLCFDVSQRSSFNLARDHWFWEIRLFCPTTPIVLVGLKTDLRDRQLSSPTLSIEKHAVRAQPSLLKTMLTGP